MGLTGWPRVAEELIIERDVRLNRGIGCRYHVQHISSGESVEIVRRARADAQVRVRSMIRRWKQAGKGLADFGITGGEGPDRCREYVEIDWLPGGIPDFREA